MIHWGPLSRSFPHAARLISRWMVNSGSCLQDHTATDPMLKFNPHHLLNSFTAASQRINTRLLTLGNRPGYIYILHGVRDGHRETGTKGTVTLPGSRLWFLSWEGISSCRPSLSVSLPSLAAALDAIAAEGEKKDCCLNIYFKPWHVQGQIGFSLTGDGWESKNQRKERCYADRQHTQFGGDWHKFAHLYHWAKVHPDWFYDSYNYIWNTIYKLSFIYSYIYRYVYTFIWLYISSIGWYLVLVFKMQNTF